MIILKIIALILGALLGLLFLLTLLSLRVQVIYKEEQLTVTLQYGFLRLTLFPKKEKKGKKKIKSEKSTVDEKIKPESSVSAKSTPPSISEPSSENVHTTEPLKSVEKISDKPIVGEEKTAKNKAVKKEKPPLRDQLEDLLQLLRVTTPALRIIRRHFIIDRLKLHCEIGGTDAHKVALNFGRHEIAVTNLFALLNEFLVLRVKKIHLQPDFLSEHSRYQGEVRLRMRLIWVLIAAVPLFFTYLKLNKQPKSSKGGQSNERKATAR